MKNHLMTALLLSALPLAASANPHHELDCANAGLDVDIGLQPTDGGEKVVVTVFDNNDDGTSFYADIKTGTLGAALSEGQELLPKVSGGESARLYVNGSVGTLNYRGQAEKLTCK